MGGGGFQRMVAAPRPSNFEGASPPPMPGEGDRRQAVLVVGPHGRPFFFQGGLPSARLRPSRLAGDADVPALASHPPAEPARSLRALSSVG